MINTELEVSVQLVLNHTQSLLFEVKEQADQERALFKQMLFNTDACPCHWRAVLHGFL